MPDLPPKPSINHQDPIFPPPPNLSPNPNPDAILDESGHLSHEEVLRRRARRLKQLERVYRKHFWGLVEEIRVKHRDYLWEFGKSPIEEENGNVVNNGDGGGEERKKCGFSGCKAKMMPLTRFCHQHILLDRDQKLYKPCGFVTKSIQNVHIKCEKPVIRATVPLLCPVHFQRMQRQISQALKKAGVTNLSRPAPKFHVLVSECVRHIQSRRRKSLNATIDEDKVNKVG